MAEKSKYFTSLDYYKRRDAKEILANALIEAGWKLYGFRPSSIDPDPGADYSFRPGSWDGIASNHNGFVLVVDVSHTSNSGKAINETIRHTKPCEHCLETGEEPDGW